MTKVNSKQKFLIIFFMTLPYIDLITSLSARLTSFPVSLGVIVKGILLAASIIYIFFFCKCRYRKKTIIYIVSICIFAVLYFLLKPDIWQLSSLLTEITYAFKYLFFPLMMVCLYNIFHDFQISAHIIKHILLINCLVYAILLLIPYFTQTGFRSYDYNFNGNTGWFYAANEIGAILVVLSIVIYDLMDNRKKWKLLLAVPIIFSLSTIGTKVSYLGIIATVISSIIMFVINNKSNRLALPSGLLCILLVCCISSSTVENMNTLSELDPLSPSTEIGREEDFAIESNDDALKIIQGNKILSAINHALSNRVLYFIKNWSAYINGGLSTILMGLGWAQRTAIDYTYYKKMIEIDFLDILLHYGVLGFSVYAVPFIYLIYKWCCNIKQIKLESYIYMLSVLLGIGISFIAGHVLGAPSVSIYLILLILLVIRQTETIQ